MNKPPVDADAFNAFEAAGWEQQVSGYEDFFGPITTRLVGPLLDAAEVGRGTRVLDVASGPGYVATAAAERGASVLGVDIAEEMVSPARRRHPHLDFSARRDSTTSRWERCRSPTRSPPWTRCGVDCSAGPPDSPLWSSSSRPTCSRRYARGSTGSLSATRLARSSRFRCR